VHEGSANGIGVLPVLFTAGTTSRSGTGPPAATPSRQGHHATPGARAPGVVAVASAGRVSARRGKRSGGAPDANAAYSSQDPLVHDTHATVELTIAVVVGSDPIRGTTRLAGGERREFWGWLDLAEIVQQMADGDRGVADELRAPSVPEGAPS
jgi:hypothetical protein